MAVDSFAVCAGEPQLEGMVFLKIPVVITFVSTSVSPVALILTTTLPELFSPQTHCSGCLQADSAAPVSTPTSVSVLSPS